MAMRDMHDGKESFRLEDDIAEALEQLGVVLGEHGASADVIIQRVGGARRIVFTLGDDPSHTRHETLHAKPATAEWSHLGLEEDI